MNMIIKYSLLQYRRMMTTNKLIFIQTIIFIPGVGFFIYLMKEGIVSNSQSMLSHVLFFIFLFQTWMIIGKRLKNEFFFSTRCYTIFPQNKINIFLYTLVFGIIDLNVVLMLVVFSMMTLYVTNWSLLVSVSFLVIFVLCEITYLIYMMVTIDIMTEKYGNSKNLILVTFSLFFSIELLTRLAEKFYLFDMYPISGWIGSTIQAILRGDGIQVIFYFSITIITAIIGLFLLNKIYYPRKNNAF